MRIKPHMLSRRVIVDIVIPNTSKRGIQLYREARRTPNDTASDWHYCQRRTPRYTAYEQRYSDLDGHAKGWPRLGEVGHIGQICEAKEKDSESVISICNCRKRVELEDFGTCRY